MSSSIERISEFNADRSSSLLALKYQAMALNPFSFLRGTCHLFYEDLPHQGIFQTAPAVWMCGDLHLQNFGSFKGNDRLGEHKTHRKLVYFDINDFDEAVLAPCSWDLVRFVVSLLVADLKLDQAEAIELGQVFLQTYAQTLITGKACAIHRETASGAVKDLLQTLRSRKRKSFIRTRLDPKVQALKRIPNKVRNVPPQDLHKVHQMMNQWSKKQPNPDFFKVLDIAHRIAGNGSLGLERYLILVEGKGYPHKSYLLDLKAARSSCLQPYLPTLQPLWETEADRIVSIQSRIQESPPALLNVLHSPITNAVNNTANNAIRNGDKNSTSYILRELQPTADKIDLVTIARHPKQLKALVQSLASITAWGHLRSGGRQRSAIADDLIAFGQTSGWQVEILDYARQYAEQVRQDYQKFSVSDLPDLKN